MAVGVPFKLKTSDSDFQDFSSIEENYLAFEVGRQYAIYDSSKGGSLGFIGSGGRAVGTLTNTSYNSSEGSHGNLVLTITSTNIFQNLSTADSVGASLHRIPVYQNDSDGQFVIREFNDSDRNTLADRLNSRIFTSDYPGSYKLASDAPSADYAVALSNVMTDTRSDSNGGASPSIQFNIYQRKTMTSPTQTLPFAVKRADGDTGTYQGLQLMTDSQIGHTLSEIGRNRITGGNSNEDYQVGSYLIRSSAQGAPTAPGTWVAKGTATDTRLTETETNFTGNFETDRASNFTGNFTSEFTNNFTNIFTGNVETDFTSNSTAGRASNFTSNSTNTFTSNSTNTFTTTTTRDSIQNFTGNFLGNFTGNFLGDYIGDFTGNFIGSGTFTSASGISYWRSSAPRQILEGTQTQPYTVSFTDYLGNNYTVQALGGISGFTSGTILTSSTEISIKLSVTKNGSSDVLPSGTVVKLLWKEGISGAGTGSITTDGTSGDASGFFEGTVTGSVPDSNAGGTAANSNSRIEVIMPNATNFVGNTTNTSTRTSTRISTRISTQDFAGNFLGNFAGDFAGDFTGDFLGNFIGDFTGDFTGNFVGDFIGNFIGGVPTDFTGDFTGNFTGNFETDRASNFTGNFVGDYTGLLLGGTSTNIETFTLYVRTA